MTEFGCMSHVTLFLFRYSHRTFKQLTDDELFDEMRTRSFPGFDDDFSDIVTPEAAAAAAGKPASASVLSTNSSVGWFHDEDIEQIYSFLVMSLRHHTVPPAVDAASISESLASATRFASHFRTTLSPTPSIKMAFYISVRRCNASLTTPPSLTEIPSNINIFKESAIAEAR